MKYKLLSILLLPLSVNIAFAGSSPDAHGPIGVMGEHIHSKGEFMLSYRYMDMGMDGVRSGQHKSSAISARTQYTASPIEMNSNMHMFGAMYGLTDKTTISLMGSYTQKDMIIERPNLTRFKRSTNGIGDIKLGAVTELYSNNINKQGSNRYNNFIYLNTSLSIPVGDHDIRDDGNVTGYMMRLGSGTFDPTLVLTYIGQRRGYSFGAQLKGTFRLYKNDSDYREGNKYEATSWAQFNLNDAVSASVIARAFRQDRLDGADPALNRNMVFAFDPVAQEREGVDLGVGLNFIIPRGSLKGQRFAIEATAPVYERINGYGLERDYRLTAGWQYAF